MDEPRWVVVDDEDDGIQYSNGDWTAENGAPWDREGNFGATYRSTLHSTVTEASFSYTYEGSRVRIYGTTNIRNESSVIDPNWECQIDGTTIPPETQFPYTENNWVFCRSDNVSPGRHTITVNVKSNGQAFMFDYLRYVASPDVNVQDAAIFISHRDLAIQYGDGWGRLDTTARMAPDAGAVITIPFYGTGFNWYALLPHELPPGSTTAEYSIDNASPTTFSVPGFYNDASQFNQLILSVKDLPRGSHTLKATSRGRNTLTPLVLSGLIIEGGQTIEPVIPNNSANPSPTPTPSSNPTKQDASSSNKTPMVAAIVGGVVGALVLIALVVLAFICYRRRSRRKESRSIRTPEPQTFTPPGPEPQIVESISRSRPLPAVPVAMMPTIVNDKQSWAQNSECHCPNYAVHVGNNGVCPPRLTPYPFMPIHNDYPSASSSETDLDSSVALLMLNRNEKPQANPSNPSLPSLGSSIHVIDHKDSGLRNPGLIAEKRPLLEYPPFYTPS